VHVVLLLHGVTGGSGIVIERLLGLRIQSQKKVEYVVQILKQPSSFIDKFQGLQEGLSLFLQLARFDTETADLDVLDSSGIAQGVVSSLYDKSAPA